MALWIKLKSSKFFWVILILLAWIVAINIFYGRSSTEVSTLTNTPMSDWFSSVMDYIRQNRYTNPVFVYVINPIRSFVEIFVDVIRFVISSPSGSNVIPLIGWLGTLSVAGYIVYATSRLRFAILAIVLLLGCGVLGMWVYTMDTLAMTLGAVILSLAIGLPIGIWAGLSDRVMNVVRPVLDLAQILPTLVYLAPLALVFLIGVAAATVATMIYSIPIAIRITAHAIRSLRAGPLEAAESMGSTRMQTLRKVQLPMAKRTIILGVNQTTLAALSFVVIAALIGAPGLGLPVIDSLMIRDVGGGFLAGGAVVLLAIMLDRSTSAAVEYSDSSDFLDARGKFRRRVGLVVGGVATIIAILASRNFLWAAVFPERIDFSDAISDWISTAASWVTDTFSFITVGFNEAFTVSVLNPLESGLTGAPWFLTVIAVSIFAAIVGGPRVSVVALLMMLLIFSTGLWFDTMVTLSQVLVAGVVVLAIGVVLGVLSGRSERVAQVLRPFLDAGQTLPAFVYLIPVLALFGPSRFAAIVCGIFYAAPIVIRIVADGVRGVSTNMMEAATSMGSSRLQTITKVQLPASKRSVLLGANQGLIFILAVIVIGAYVGAGGLGYLVIAGLSKPEIQGKGIAAGLAIVSLGVVLDRIAHAAAHREPKRASVVKP